MKTELPTTLGAKPDGWPRWLWCLVRLSVAPEHRAELLTPDQRAHTVRALAEKLTQSRKDWNDWRNRALSAERCVSYEVPTVLKAACERHDREHSTNLMWRL